MWWTIAAVTNNQNNIQIRKNGSTFVISQTQTLSGNGYSQNATKLVYLNGSTDYVDFTAYTGNSSAQSLQWGGNSSGQGTFFSAALMTTGVGATGAAGATGATGSAGVTGYLSVTTQSGASYTIAANDISNLVMFTNSSTVTVTIPPYSSVAWTTGNNIDLLQKGAGQVVISPGVGVTIRTTGLAKTRDQYSAVSLVYIGADEWLLQGDTAVT